MGNGIFITIFLMLLLFNGLSAVAQTQTVEAVVDRHIIHVDETFRLTIRLRGPHTHVTLDLSPLSEDFDLLDTSEHSQSRDINGQTETMTEWIITLAPKRLGELVIPSIHVGRHHSPPVTVTVLSLDRARQGIFTPQADFS